MDKIYYVLNDNKNQILETDDVDYLVQLLFDNKADFISDDQLKHIQLTTDNMEDYFANLRHRISTNKHSVPMYDIYSDRIFPIKWKNVYPRFFYDNYRMIDSKFYKKLLSIKNPDLSDVEKIRILSYYDIRSLQQSYMKLFYKSFIENNYITDCRRPSFYSGVDHISPYYTINEINYLAYDWDISKKFTLDTKELNVLCSKISKYDISAVTLRDHQMYIYNAKAIGLVKLYSLYGSYFMNKYLRTTKCCIADACNDMFYRNLVLENQIDSMINLIKSAPAFDKSYTVYRFVETDNHLTHLKVGDIYQDPSFTSTTRNPFYYKENYAFGYILIKIKLPAGVKGIGLCIEAYSNFPNEEEIILLPASRYRLIDVIIEKEKTSDFHQNFKLYVKKKYVFEFINRMDNVQISLPNAIIPATNHIKMSDIFFDDRLHNTKITNRLTYFRENYLSVNNQFRSTIGDIEYIFTLQAYSSVNVYKPFFYYETSDGIMITSSHPSYGNIELIIEIGKDLHVNYYFKFSISDEHSVINLDHPDWIEWLSYLAFVLGCQDVIIHPNYTLLYNDTDTTKQKIIKTKYTFCSDIYDYIKFQRKRFETYNVTKLFDYFQFNKLNNTDVFSILFSSDGNELYNIAFHSKITNLRDFYIYVVEKYPKYLKLLESKIYGLYEPNQNPFINMMYKLDPWAYLYNIDKIKAVPAATEFHSRKTAMKKLIGERKIPRFKNRLREFIEKSS